MSLANINRVFERWFSGIGCIDDVAYQSQTECGNKCKFAKIHLFPNAPERLDSCREKQTGFFQVSVYLSKLNCNDCTEAFDSYDGLEIIDCITCSARADSTLTDTLPDGTKITLQLFRLGSRNRSGVLPKPYPERTEAGYSIFVIDIPFTYISCGCD